MEQPAQQDSAVAPGAADTTTAVDTDAALVEALSTNAGDAQTEDDEIEDEHDGVKMRGKKADVDRAKAERLMQADYTRKTQAAAAERTNDIAQRQLNMQQQQLQQQVVEEMAGVKAIERQLANFDKVDWRALAQADPGQAQQLTIERDELRNAHNQALNSLGLKQAQTLQQHQAGLAKLTEQAHAYLSREIKDWNGDRDRTVAEYVLKQGVPAAAISNVMAHMPQFGVMAHKAELWDALNARVATSKPKPEVQAAPVTRIAPSRAKANTNPDSMSSEDYRRWRLAGQAKRG